MKKNHNVKMHVKCGDSVKIIAGKYKGQTGSITKVIRETSQVIIQGINLKTKHKRPIQDGQTGEVIKIEFPVHSSNVKLNKNID